MHLLSGDVPDSGGTTAPSSLGTVSSGQRDDLARLEGEVHELRREVADLKMQVERFRKAFE